MSSDEDIPMDDVDTAPMQSFKGKGKAVNGDYSHDENLPWYVVESRSSARAEAWRCAGWRSIDPSLLTMSSRIRISQAQVSDNYSDD